MAHAMALVGAWVVPIVVGAAVIGVSVGFKVGEFVGISVGSGDGDIVGVFVGLCDGGSVPNDGLGV